MELGRLKEELILWLWNRLPGYNFVLVFFCISIIVIYCHLSLLCLKMALDGLKLVAANKTSSSQKVFDLVLCSIDTIWKCLTPAGHPNSKSKKKDSLQVWTGCTTLKFSQITLSRTLGILLDPCGEKEWWEGRQWWSWWSLGGCWNEIKKRRHLIQKVRTLGIRET